MKKILVLLLCFSFTLSVSACSSKEDEAFALPPGLEYDNTYTVADGITLSLEYDNYPENVQSMKMTLENRTDNVMLYGNGWSFEKYSYKNGNETWKTVETKDDVAFTAEGYTLSEYDKQTFVIPTSFLKNGLSEGLYRVTGCSLRVAEDENNLSAGGQYTDYPPYVLEFVVTKDSESPANSEIIEGGSALPKKEDWQWYTVWNAEKLYRQNGYMIWQFVENENGLIAVLFREDTLENEYLNEGDTLMLDIFDRKTGEIVHVFENKYLELNSVTPLEDGSFEIIKDNVTYCATIENNILIMGKTVLPIERAPE